MSSEPPRAVLAAFGTAGDPLPLEAGPRSSWAVGDLILKPLDLAEDELAWQAELLPSIRSDGFRVDGAELARMHLGNSARHVELAPELFRLPDEEGLVEFFERGIVEDSARADVLALVAEIGDEVAGYLEARLLPPMETARWQSGPDLARTRLHINALGTVREFQRRGVATALVEAAEGWSRDHGATIATSDTWIDSPMSVPFWEQRMNYARRAVILRKSI